jgi:hypothetical protein
MSRCCICTMENCSLRSLACGISIFYVHPSTLPRVLAGGAFLESLTTIDLTRQTSKCWCIQVACFISRLSYRQWACRRFTVMGGGDQGSKQALSHMVHCISPLTRIHTTSGRAGSGAPMSMTGIMRAPLSPSSHTGRGRTKS